jgi:hypothetical protein
MTERGLDNPQGGNVSVDMLMAVTNREIAAGRMTEDHSIRKHAVEFAAKPHMSHAELVERAAQIKAAVHSIPPKSPSKAESFGAALGRGVKRFLRLLRPLLRGVRIEFGILASLVGRHRVVAQRRFMEFS